jgi:hypothetical protein
VKIVDTGFAQMLVAPWSMMMANGLLEGIEQRLREGDVVRQPAGLREVGEELKTRGAQPAGWQAVPPHARRQRHSDTKVLQEFAGQMDFGKLAALK